jgi:hypothetical protein
MGHFDSDNVGSPRRGPCVKTVLFGGLLNQPGSIRCDVYCVFSLSRKTCFFHLDDKGVKC